MAIIHSTLAIQHDETPLVAVHSFDPDCKAVELRIAAYDRHGSGGSLYVAGTLAQIRAILTAADVALQPFEAAAAARAKELAETLITPTTEESGHAPR